MAVEVEQRGQSPDLLTVDSSGSDDQLDVEVRHTEVSRMVPYERYRKRKNLLHKYQSLIKFIGRGFSHRAKQTDLKCLLVFLLNTPG